MHTHTPPNSISDDPVTNLLSLLCILIEILSRADVKGAKKALMVSNLAFFIGRFQTDPAASMAVKGLNRPTNC